ncbi:tetratricopeptide (TPR) repeat protein [Kibdelosporangium banguiense]|uniref:Tetratricopeptide (TPR) repeat protein n=1 Tax=Kibdelosporangium banguiense TaxID=1365924 RepID=A0ABS4T6Z3_9PSEU|nr:tetratricopeptide repeat protein [Kibdelosporangium banguiense]MBP2320148.1 tetratricopeptide (TPR) repeat protein [Kibdelosporangium banguiense]
MHRTILVLDVAGFGDLRRTHHHQMAVRDGLYSLVKNSFTAAGISWASSYKEDRGDGVLIIVEPATAKGVFVEKLPPALVAALRDHNAGHRAEEQIRLRMALHAGEIHYDSHGVVGRAVNLAFRLGDSQTFREVMSSTDEPLAVITSQWFFDEVVWHSSVAADYHRIQISAKEVDTTAWLSFPATGAQPAQTVAPPPDRSVPRQLPMRSPQFVGREAEIAGLTASLADTGTVVITAIDGTAGIGKTTLAMQWAHQVKDRFPDGQLHVNLRGFDPGEPMDPDQALHGFLQALGVALNESPAGVEAKAALYRTLLADRRVLIVLDNARTAEQIRPLLPGSPTCLVIITSRNRLDGLIVREGARRIALDVLPAADAMDLLAERVGRDRLDAEPEATAQLLDLCARLPLALSIAAQSDQPISSLVAELRDERNRLDTLDLGDTDLSLRSVFSWSYNVLTPAAAHLFRLLGLHPGPDISRHACGSLTGRPAGPLKELVSANLLTEYLPGRYRLHDLLRTYAAEIAATDPERDNAAAKFLEYYLCAASHADKFIQPNRRGLIVAPPGFEPPDIASYAQAMDWFNEEHAVLLAAITFAGDNGHATYAWKLAWACTTFLRRTGRYHERASVYRIAVAATRREGDEIGLVTSLRHLATASARLGQLQQALDYLDEAGAMLKAADDDRVVQNHLAYVRVLEAQGHPAKALEYARLAWDLVQGGEPTRVADVLTAMGRQLALLRRHAEALPMCEQALQLYSSVGHQEGEADVLLNIGDIERHRQRHAEALRFYRQSLDLDRQLGDRYWAAIALERIADVHRDVGDRELAAEVLTESLVILEDLRHADAGRVRTKLTGDTAEPGSPAPR